MPGCRTAPRGAGLPDVDDRTEVQAGHVGLPPAPFDQLLWADRAHIAPRTVEGRTGAPVRRRSPASRPEGTWSPAKPLRNGRRLPGADGPVRKDQRERNKSATSTEAESGQPRSLPPAMVGGVPIRSFETISEMVIAVTGDADFSTRDAD